MAMNAALLSQQNSATSQAVLEAYLSNETFISLSDKLSKDIQQRDDEDGEKLQKGIDLAISKGVLPADVKVEQTNRISVSGMSADQVTDAIIEKLGDAPSKGCVMTLQGLSGTGKGTTVAKLAEKLPNAKTWSNGNLFRSYTLLTVTYAEQNGKTVQECLTPEILGSFKEMLVFDKFGDTFDVKIEGLGLKLFVSEVEKTVLKEERVGKNIPTVAEVTQGEVVAFVQDAFQKMAAGGINVLVEGREQTLNYIRSPHRFELFLDNPGVIGQRQAALRMGGKAWDTVGKSMDADEAAIKTALDDALASMTSA